jgi:hypothetical protein
MMQILKKINSPDADIARFNKLIVKRYIFHDVSPLMIPYRNNINFLSILLR